MQPSMRTLVWLVLPMTGCLALPPQPAASASSSASASASGPTQGQDHGRGSVRAKQTTPVLLYNNSNLHHHHHHHNSNRLASTTIASVPSAAASMTPTASTGVSNSTSSSLTSSSLSSLSSLPSSSSIGVTEKTSSRTSSSSLSSSLLSSSSPGGSTDLVSSTRKATTSVDVSTTSAAPFNSAKETRESPGKIRPQIKLNMNYTSASETGVRLPEGASAALAKPTKYHYYPHNQHIYLLPECAVQQVCNAVYVRLNFTQPLCACPGRYRDPCSASLDSDDLHTTELVTDPRTKALTLVKTCEPIAEMRECRAPRDWSLLALQNIRTGKSHYLVICRCPDTNILEGPMSHDQPTYASVPGIRVYGMMCVQGNRRGRPLRHRRSLLDLARNERSAEQPSATENEKIDFPWDKVPQLMKTAIWE